MGLLLVRTAGLPGQQAVFSDSGLLVFAAIGVFAQEQARLDREAEEKRAAFEAEMKARSANLKHQTTKQSASIKDMFAG